MYLVIVVGLMAILPIVFVAGEYAIAGGGHIVWLIGKWFVFWAVGARLGLAALRQIYQPEFTTRGILGIKDASSGKIARELGFANLSIALIALVSLVRPTWLLPAAVAGGLFFGLAGIEHLRHANRNRHENIAMVSDLAIFLVLLTFVVVSLTMGVV